MNEDREVRGRTYAHPHPPPPPDGRRKAWATARVVKKMTSFCMIVKKIETDT